MYHVVCCCQRAEVDLEVMQPLNRLLLMFQGPMKVIKKRHDKELDFNKMSSRVGNLKDTEQLKSVSFLPVMLQLCLELCEGTGLV